MEQARRAIAIVIIGSMLFQLGCRPLRQLDSRTLDVSRGENASEEFKDTLALYALKMAIDLGYRPNQEAENDKTNQVIDELLQLKDVKKGIEPFVSIAERNFKGGSPYNAWLAASAAVLYAQKVDPNYQDVADVLVEKYFAGCFNIRDCSRMLTPLNEIGEYAPAAVMKKLVGAGPNGFLDFHVIDTFTRQFPTSSDTAAANTVFKYVYAQPDSLFRRIILLHMKALAVNILFFGGSGVRDAYNVGRNPSLHPSVIQALRGHIDAINAEYDQLFLQLAANDLFQGTQAFIKRFVDEMKEQVSQDVEEQLSREDMDQKDVQEAVDVYAEQVKGYEEIAVDVLTGLSQSMRGLEVLDLYLDRFNQDSIRGWLERLSDPDQTQPALAYETLSKFWWYEMYLPDRDLYARKLIDLARRKPPIIRADPRQQGEFITAPDLQAVQLENQMTAQLANIQDSIRGQYGEKNPDQVSEEEGGFMGSFIPKGADFNDCQATMTRNDYFENVNGRILPRIYVHEAQLAADWPYFESLKFQREFYFQRFMPFSAAAKLQEIKGEDRQQRICEARKGVYSDLDCQNLTSEQKEMVDQDAEVAFRDRLKDWMDRHILMQCFNLTTFPARTFDNPSTCVQGERIDLVEACFGGRANYDAFQRYDVQQRREFDMTRYVINYNSERLDGFHRHFLEKVVIGKFHIWATIPLLLVSGGLAGLVVTTPAKIFSQLILKKALEEVLKASARNFLIYHLVTVLPNYFAFKYIHQKLSQATLAVILGDWEAASKLASDPEHTGFFSFSQDGMGAAVFALLPLIGRGTAMFAGRLTRIGSPAVFEQLGTKAARYLRSGLHHRKIRAAFVSAVARRAAFVGIKVGSEAAIFTDIHFIEKAFHDFFKGDNVHEAQGAVDYLKKLTAQGGEVYLQNLLVVASFGVHSGLAGDFTLESPRLAKYKARWLHANRLVSKALLARQPNDSRLESVLNIYGQSKTDYRNIIEAELRIVHGVSKARAQKLVDEQMVAAEWWWQVPKAAERIRR